MTRHNDSPTSVGEALTSHKVGDQTGEFFIIYKPDAFDAARGVWSVTV